MIVIARCELPKVRNRNSAQPIVSRMGTIYSRCELPKVSKNCAQPTVSCLQSRDERHHPPQV